MPIKVIMRTQLVTYLVVAAAFFIVGWMWIPTRVTYGAGSLRCGTALNPTTDTEIGPTDCVQVASMRIADLVQASLVLAAIGIVGVSLSSAFAQGGIVSVSVQITFIIIYVLALGLALFWITGAYSVD